MPPWRAASGGAAPGGRLRGGAVLALHRHGAALHEAGQREAQWPAAAGGRGGRGGLQGSLGLDACGWGGWESAVQRGERQGKVASVGGHQPERPAVNVTRQQARTASTQPPT